MTRIIDVEPTEVVIHQPTKKKNKRRRKNPREVHSTLNDVLAIGNTIANNAPMLALGFLAMVLERKYHGQNEDRYSQDSSQEKVVSPEADD